MDDTTASTIRLQDGRRLGYADLGDAGGTPVFYFHGFPSSRLEACMVEEHARRLGVRLLAVDRPGYGLSDDLPGRTIPDWPDDVVALADALGLERFAVVGSSGGGPYAIACAARIRLVLNESRRRLPERPMMRVIFYFYPVRGRRGTERIIGHYSKAIYEFSLWRSRCPTKRSSPNSTLTACSQLSSRAMISFLEKSNRIIRVRRCVLRCRLD